MKKRLRVGIIGCGAIGGEIALACQGRLKKRIELVGICDTDKVRCEALKNRLKPQPKVMDRLELIKRGNLDLVVEAASAKVSADIVKECLKAKRNVLVMSAGGLLGRRGLLNSILRADSKVYLPSGAICGIDGLKAASIGRIGSARMTTRKPPGAFEGAPYIMEKRIDLNSVTKETTLFEGTAKEAVEAFPQNINVAATLSLTGIGEENVKVRIVTSPDYLKNVHEVEIEGDFGAIMTRTENIPSEANPKTSYLAILSAIAALEGIANNFRVGT